MDRGVCVSAAACQAATTDGERIVACISMIAGAFLFAYVVGSVCNIAASLSEDANECVSGRMSTAQVL